MNLEPAPIWNPAPLELPKMSADTPRIVVSSFVPRDTAYVMNGDLFEDGKKRIVVPDHIPADTIAQLTEQLTEADRVRSAIDLINELLTGKDTRP